MGDVTGISWTQHTFNSWIGCTALSPACAFCYAKTLVENRMGRDFEERWRTSPANWKKPLAWDRAACKAGVKAKVFCASLADVFDNQVPPQWRADLWALIRATPNLIWQLLTKRPQNIAKMLPPDWGDGYPNVWLGTTAEDDDHYRQRWPHIARIPATLRFVSYEPALGPLGALGINGLPRPDWVICGGESGTKARPMHPDWARSVRDQCERTGIPFHFKQWGEFYPDDDAPDAHTAMRRVGKKRAGHLLDGIEHKAVPNG